jgi:hypothetical protein
VTPVAAVTKWFPDKRGLGSGMVVMGFGLGAFFYNNILKAIPAFAEASREAGRVLATRADGATGATLSAGATGTIMRTFVVSGILLAVLGGLCALVLRNPPATAPAAAPAATATARTARDYPPSQALRTPQFWALWMMLFLNVTAGILFISNAVPIMRELTGTSPETALAVYGFIALFNGLGRFFWGACPTGSGGTSPTSSFTGRRS